MNKILLVFRNEFITTITRRSFLITLFLVPVASIVLGIVVTLFGSSTGQVVSQVFGSSPKNIVEGYVDESGLIRSLPADVKPGRFIAYSTQAGARQALGNGEIEAFYLVPSNYIQEGTVYYIRPDFN